MAEAALGSVAETPAGNPPPQTPPADNGSATGGGNSWLSGLSEGNRKLAETKGWTAPESADKVLSSYAELERMQGESLRMPKPDAAPDEWKNFYSKLGRPESPDKYEFKRPENLPADIAYSDDLAKAAKPWMHEAGLNPKQAQQVHDKFVGYAAQQEQARKAAIVQAVEQTHDDLIRDPEWGPKDSETFKTKYALADRALKKLGLTEAYQKSGLILSDGSLTDPQIAKAFAKIGEAMFREDTIDGGGGAMTGENPFKRDPAGKIKSPGAISALIKSDPERAKRLAREAGEPESNWFSANPL